MKKAAMVSKLIQAGFVSNSKEADHFFKLLDAWGFKPPTVSEEYAQALMSVYIDPSFCRWEEDLDKDPKIVAALERGQAWKQK